ncbi:hypothetical protein [Paraburkholderia mimosarum]|uniref:hypothetical protein n=1 Tax=Paraburkholderia mimosarum TaxID=312026 RepID=UPI00041F0C8E|nr:hypothetical protein [Paraburkholderia mimosarum]
MSIQAYDINLGPAGSNTATQVIEASAQICDFLSSGSAFDQIEVRPNFMQGAATLKLGQGFDAGAIIDRWLIVNKGATAIAGQVMLSTAGFRNFRISGDVNVLDGGKSRTLANLAYAGFTASSPAAGNYARLQLWNPAASGKRAVVEALWLWGSAATTILIQDSTAALANTYEAASPKLLGGVAGAATCMYDTTAVQPVTPSIIGIQVIAAQLQIVKFAEPIVIPPGHGLLAASQGVSVGTTANFEWYEEPNT